MRPSPTSSVQLLALSLFCAGLSGCALNGTDTALPGPLAGAAIKGRVHGGQQPVTGAHVYMLAANITGAGQPSLSLLKNGIGTKLDSSGGATNGFYYVLSDALGNFDISGDYTCTANSQVYLYSLGGDPGIGTENPKAGLMAALGNCPVTGTFLLSTPLVEINEVSTIAAAYSFAGYATDALHVSSSGTALAQIGIANAFATTVNLVDLPSGTALSTTPGSSGSGSNQNIGTVPTDEINALADIVSACINSDPSTSTSCSTLLGYAKNGSATPTDTATAAINIAHNPGANVAGLFGLIPGMPPFPSGLNAAPNDWTIVLNISASLSNSGANSIAIDAFGDIWMTGSEVDEISPSGVQLTGYSGYYHGGISEPQGIAIDASDHLWVSNGGANTVTELSSNGTPMSGANGYAVGPGPTGIALDAANHVWVTNYSQENNALSSVSELNTNDGTNVTGSPFTGGGISEPIAVAIDASGSAWIADLLTYATQIGSTGTVTGYTNPGPLLYINPNSVAIDAVGNKWFSDQYGSNGYGYYLTELTGSGSGFVDKTYTTDMTPLFISHVAIDGSGNVWVTALGYNASSNYDNWLAEFSSAGVLLSPPNGFHDPGLLCEDAANDAIDGSGNVWVACSNGTLMEYVGAATPVVTPIVANLLTPYTHPASTP